MDIENTQEHSVELISQGGWMMQPLLLLSVAALTVIIERFLFYSTCPLHLKRMDELVQKALRDKDMNAIVDSLSAMVAVRPYADALRQAGEEQGEAALQLAGAAVLRRLGARLSLLSLMGRMAPLLGLLGTIVGMITTFSRLAEAQSGVDMTLLADGIWQALLTTAAGLLIAIPTLFAHHCFATRRALWGEVLADIGNAALVLTRRA